MQVGLRGCGFPFPVFIGFLEVVVFHQKNGSHCWPGDLWASYQENVLEMNKEVYVLRTISERSIPTVASLVVTLLQRMAIWNHQTALRLYDLRMLAMNKIHLILIFNSFVKCVYNRAEFFFFFKLGRIPITETGVKIWWIYWCNKLRRMNGLCFGKIHFLMINIIIVNWKRLGEAVSTFVFTQLRVEGN